MVVRVVDGPAGWCGVELVSVESNLGCEVEDALKVVRCNHVYCMQANFDSVHGKEENELLRLRLRFPLLRHLRHEFVHCEATETNCVELAILNQVHVVVEPAIGLWANATRPIEQVHGTVAVRYAKFYRSAVRVVDLSS